MPTGEDGAVAVGKADAETAPAVGLRQTALRAAMKLLREEGWDAVTQARVAEASGVGRATVYRYWSDRTQLIRDAVVARLVVTPHILPTGEFRADLIDELRYLRHYLTENDLAPLLAALIHPADRQPALLPDKAAPLSQLIHPIPS